MDLKDLAAMASQPLIKRRQAWKFIYAMQEHVPSIVKELFDLRKKRASRYTDEGLRSIMQTATPDSVIGQLVSEIRRLTRD